MLVAQLAGPLHLALVTHVTCEHGELIDAPARAGQEVGRSSDEATDVATAGSDAVVSGEHDHCLANALRRQAGTHSPSRLALSAPWRAVLLPVFVDGIAPRRAPLSVAPKQGPPA